MNYKTYADLSTDILENIHIFPHDLDLVVGIPRSGMIPAYILATQLNLDVVSLSEFLTGKNSYSGRRSNNFAKLKPTSILVLDDSIDSGFAMNKAKSEIREANIKEKIIYGAIYSSVDNTKDVDFYLKFLPQPRIFQWNYKNHFIATKSCYDIDGVLCVDPTDEENDDAENYRFFLENAKPLFLPKIKISCLVTSRLEKYRIETENWLAKHNIQYDNLIMMNLNSAEERRALSIHGEFKAEIFKNRYEELFVESNWQQAKIIFEKSNKPVICTANDVFISNYADIVFYENQLARNNRSLIELFAESSEMGNNYQSLLKEHEKMRYEISKLRIKYKKILNNKWYQFSKLNRKKKLQYFLDVILSKK